MFHVLFKFNKYFCAICRCACLQITGGQEKELFYGFSYSHKLSQEPFEQV